MKKSDAGLLLLRLFAAIRIVYGVADNVISTKHMHTFQNFLAANNFPAPLFSAYMSVYVQLVCGLLLFAGWKTKWASLLLIINFLVAVFMVHIPKGDSFEAMTPALALLFVCACLFFTGPGKFAIDNRTNAR